MVHSSGSVEMDSASKVSESLGSEATLKIEMRHVLGGSCAADAASKFKTVETLNDDPHNVRAEELALEECMRGVKVRRTWTEKSLVMNFGGVMAPGTPDGMFEDWNGDLTCVQVVRVPISQTMDAQEMGEVLYQTVLTKIVKSQKWMIATRTKPRYFIIFCWLPRLQEGYPEISGERTQALLDWLKPQGWPFYVRAMVPDRGDQLFPAKFAFNLTCQEGHDDNSQQGHRASKLYKRNQKISEADLSTVDPCSLDDDDEEDDMIWDIFESDSEVHAAMSEDTESTNEGICKEHEEDELSTVGSFSLDHADDEDNAERHVRGRR